MDPATTEIYTYGHTLSRHDALPIGPVGGCIAHRAAVLFDNSTEPCLSHRRGNAVRCAEAELRRVGRIEARVENGRQSISYDLEQSIVLKRTPDQESCPSTRLQHPSYLGQRRRHVADEHQPETTGDSVEAGGGEGQGLGKIGRAHV